MTVFHLYIRTPDEIKTPEQLGTKLQGFLVENKAFADKIEVVKPTKRKK